MTTTTKFFYIDKMSINQRSARPGVTVLDNLNNVVLVNGEQFRLENFDRLYIRGEIVVFVDGAYIPYDKLESRIDEVYRDGSEHPVIDMNVGQDVELNVRSYSGGLTLLNCDTVESKATVELTAGQVEITNSCTLGFISVRGVCSIQDWSNGTVIDTASMVGNIVDTSNLSIDSGQLATDIASQINVQSGGGEHRLVRISSILKL